MMGKSLKVLQTHVVESSSFSHVAFIRQQMTVVLQKLLKTIPSEKAGPHLCHTFYYMFMCDEPSLQDNWEID